MQLRRSNRLMGPIQQHKHLLQDSAHVAEFDNCLSMQSSRHGISYRLHIHELAHEKLLMGIVYRSLASYRPRTNLVNGSIQKEFQRSTPCYLERTAVRMSKDPRS